jgi:hypothetical protein
MKLKTLLLGLFFTISLGLYSQNVVVGVEYVSGQYIVEEATYSLRTFEMNHTVFVIEMDKQIGKFTPYIKTEVWCQGADLNGIQPRIAVYKAGINFTPIKKIDIKFEHVCIHKVVSVDSENKNYITGGYDKIGIYYKF